MSLPLAITSLIPHRAPMLLLDELISHGHNSIVCGTTIRDDMPFVADGAVPALIALELFAQAAAALVAHSLVKNKKASASASGSLFGRGAFLGTNKVTLHEVSIAVGDALQVHCELRGLLGTSAEVECALVRGEDVVADGSILVAVS